MARATNSTRLTHRADLARDLARINMMLGAISLDGNLAEFATEQQLAEFRAGLQRARREVQAAELALHDLVFGVQIRSVA